MGDPQTESRISSTHSFIVENLQLHIPRILALDGGGVRGLSSLLILEKLMQEIQRLKGESSDDEPPLPCEYFDLICGASTGGLIAIMLGRLRMVRGHKIDIN
jgi:patatin-like phospholipase/acyl hydrolase